jgi:MFS family permease
LHSEEKLIIYTAAWFGSLVNGPLADKFGRKLDMIVAVAIFLTGSAIQAGAINLVMLFLGNFHVHNPNS